MLSSAIQQKRLSLFGQRRKTLSRLSGHIERPMSHLAKHSWNWPNTHRFISGKQAPRETKL